VDLSSFRGLVNCSEPVTHESQAQFSNRFRPYGLREDVFWGCYAMAETTFALTHSTDTTTDTAGPEDTASPRDVYVSVGSALPEVEIRIVSDDGSTLADRQLGEIHVRTPFTFAGYFNDPDSTAGAFTDGWYRTGDVGYLARDALYVLDRRKDVMIVGGVNVFPSDLEEVISSCEGVVPGRASAFSAFDASLQTERVVVLLETDARDSAGRQAVLVDARRRVLATFQIANFEIHAVPPGWLVKSSAGKISRAQNRDKWQREHGPPPSLPAAAGAPNREI
jgi:acyl-CoA synthetase (AMP-forming)/AMP-acid ligase II